MHLDDRTQHTIGDTHTNTDTNDAKWQPTEMFRTRPPKRKTLSLHLAYCQCCYSPR